MKDEFYTEDAKQNEHFDDFRARMIDKAIEEDLGIVKYSVDNIDFDADEVPTMSGKLTCTLRKKVFE